MNVPVIDRYQLLATVTQDMLAAANSGHWDEFIILNKERDRVFSEIRKLDASSAPEQTVLETRAHLIRQILENEAMTRPLVENWMRDFESKQAETRQQLRVLREYRKNLPSYPT